MIRKVLEEQSKVEYFVWLASQQWKGTPEEYARKLGVSRATLYNKIRILKQGGIPVVYDKGKGCFVLERPVEIIHSIKVKFLDTGEEYEVRRRLDEIVGAEDDECR